MSFIGNAPAAIPTSFQAVQADSFNGNGSTTNFTLSRQITNLYDIEVLVDNVQQSPYDGSYSVNGTTITFSSAPGSGTNNIYIVYRDHPITSIAPKGQEIELFSSGGGTFTVAPTSSATDRTFTLPDETGTVLTSASDVAASALTGDIAAARITDALNATGSAPIYACRAWVNFNGTGTVAIRASGNVSSITDRDTGQYTVNFTNAMPDTNYSYTLNSQGTATATGSTTTYNPTTGTQSTTALEVASFSDTAYQDHALYCVTIFR